MYKKNKFSSLTVKENTKFYEILKTIEKNGLGGVFVENKKKQIIGIVTDADLRKKLLLDLKNISSVSIKHLMQKKFYYKNYGSKYSMNDILVSGKTLIPILDKNNRLKDYLHLKQIKINKNINDRILVIGGFGYIGSLLVEKLINKGFKVNVLDKNFYGNFIPKKIQRNKNLRIFIGDCNNRKSLESSLKKCKHVIHLGEIVGDPAVNINKKFSIKNNFLSINKVTNACMKYNIEKFIFMSSCSVYGASDILCSEKSKLNPVSLYAKCKIQSEKIILNRALKSSLCPIILRLSTVHGLSHRHRLDLVANKFTAYAQKKKYIKLFGGGNWRPFIHVKDICDIILTCLKKENNKVKNKIYNIGSNKENYQIQDILKILSKKIKFSVESDKTFNDRRNYRVSFKKFNKDFNYKFKYDLKKSLFEMLKFYQFNKINIDYINFDNEKKLLKILKKK